MNVIGRGLIAGFLASLAISLLVEPITSLARSAGVSSIALGWGIHFIVGSVIWGVGFAFVHSWLKGPFWLRGVSYGIVAWLIVMVGVMPLSRAGLFGLNLGWTVAGVMLVAHLIYGGLLGAIFGLIDDETETEHSHDGLHPCAR